MTSLIAAPLYFTYNKVKEHRDGKRRITNTARYEDLRREHEGNWEQEEEERMRLDAQRMKTGFAMPEPGEDGRVRLSHDWESDREREYEERYYANLRASRTGLRPASTGRNPYQRESWHGDYRTGMAGDQDWMRGRESPVPRRSLQQSRLGYEVGSNESLSDRSSRHTAGRSDPSHSREQLPAQPVEAPKAKESEPQDMASLFVDDILRERGLSS